jgi:hypothetical protein
MSIPFSSKKSHKNIRRSFISVDKWVIGTTLSIIAAALSIGGGIQIVAIESLIRPVKR